MIDEETLKRWETSLASGRGLPRHEDAEAALIAEVRRLRAPALAPGPADFAVAQAMTTLHVVTRERDALRDEVRKLYAKRDAMWQALIGIVSVLEGDVSGHSLAELDHARATEWDWWPKRLEEDQRHRLRDIWAVYMVRRIKLDEVKS